MRAVSVATAYTTAVNVIDDVRDTSPRPPVTITTDDVTGTSSSSTSSRINQSESVKVATNHGCSAARARVRAARLCETETTRTVGELPLRSAAVAAHLYDVIERRHELRYEAGLATQRIVLYCLTLTQ